MVEMNKKKKEKQNISWLVFLNVDVVWNLWFETCEKGNLLMWKNMAAKIEREKNIIGHNEANSVHQISYLPCCREMGTYDLW